MSSPITKILGFIAFSVIFIQIIVSLVYSNQIIIINQTFNQQRRQTDELNRQLEKLQNNLSDLQSITLLNQASPSASLSPVTKYLKINE